MTNAVYYSEPAEESPLVEIGTEIGIAIADEIIEKIIDDNLPRTISAITRRTGVIDPITEIIEISRTGEDWFVGGTRVAAETILQYGLYTAIGIAVAGALVSTSISAVVIGIAVAAITVVVYSVFEDQVLDIGDVIDDFFGTTDEEFILKSASGGVLGGAIYINGTSPHSTIEAVSELVARALVDGAIGDPTATSTIEYVRADEVVDVFAFGPEDLFAMFAAARTEAGIPTTRAEVESWGWARDHAGATVSNAQIATLAGTADEFFIASTSGELAFRVNTAAFAEDLTFAYSKIGTSLQRPTSAGGTQLLIGQDGLDNLEGFQADRIFAYAGAGVDNVLGSVGDDVIYGGSGNDNLFGFAGDDQIFGGADDDEIYGHEAATEAGNTLEGGDGNDTIYGGVDTDRIQGNNGDDTIFGSTGSDTINGDGFEEFGTDVLDYTMVAESLEFGLEIAASGGSPAFYSIGQFGVPDGWSDRVQKVEKIILSGQTDVVLLEGSLENYDGLEIDAAGNANVIDLKPISFQGLPVNTVRTDGDTISLEALTPIAGGGQILVDLDDQETGTVKDGRLLAGAVTMTLTGFENVLGSSGRDIVLAADGRSGLFGFDGDDVLVGRGGQDLLVGGAGADVLAGGFWEVGSFATVGEDGAVDILYGGAGDDVYLATNNDKIFDMTLQNFGGIGDGSIWFNGLELGGGVKVDPDIYPPGPGVTGAFGAQIAVFRDHANAMVYRVFNAVIVQDGVEYPNFLVGVEDQNTDQVIEIVDFAYDEEAETGSFLGIELGAARPPDGSPDGDRLPGTNDDDVIDGGGGNDALQLKNGNDIGYGGSGDDVLSGGKGDDTLEGGAGADNLKGEAGNDTISYLQSNGGVRIDLQNRSADFGDATGDKFSKIENVAGSGFGDILIGDTGDNVLTGYAGNDVFAGNGGLDVFDGGRGRDAVSFELETDAAAIVNLASGAHGGAAAGATFISIEDLVGTDLATAGDSLTGDANSNRLFGLAGDDTLVALVGNDVLSGGDGNDRLVAGTGNDLLDGGTGNDVFAFGLGDGANTLLNLELAADRIEFSGLTFANLTILASAAGTEIAYGPGDSLDLVGIAPGDVTEALFDFV